MYSRAWAIKSNYNLFYFKVRNIQNTFKMARSFLCAQNVVQYQRNLRRIHALTEREDYIGLCRTWFYGLSRAVRAVQAACKVIDVLEEVGIV